MKKKILFTTFFICSFTLAFTQALSTNEAKTLLQKVDTSTNFSGYDFTADYAIVQDVPGQGKSIMAAKIHRRDTISAYTILMTEPQKDKGKAYLQRDNTIWFFDPADKKFTSTSAKDNFQNTNVQQKDFAPQAFSNDYSIAEAKKEKLGSLDVVCFHLKAKTNQADYPIVKIWVSEDGLLRKKEEYSLSGQLLRSTAIPSYQKVRSNNIERFLPVAMLIVDNLRGKKIDGKMDYEKTQVSIKNVSFEKLSDLVYTKQYLELAH